MKFLLTILLTVLLHTVQSQDLAMIQQAIEMAIQSSKINTEDKTALVLVNDLYEGFLQDDLGMGSQELFNRMDNFLKNPNSYNKHLITLVVAYQDYVEQVTAAGMKPDNKIQLFLIDKAEEEYQKLYGKVPTLVFIYKAEAYNADKQYVKADQIIAEGLKIYPNSIPLKVYYFLSTEDESVKKDLIENHSNHWMVKQFGIK